MPVILAEELDTLTAQDIEEWDRSFNGTCIFISVIDKGNITDAREKRLRSLVREREEASASYAVKADELNAKLQQISPRRLLTPRHPLTPSDTASTPVTAGAELTEEEVIEIVQCIAYGDYEKLKSMGGRPAQEINPDPGSCPASKSVIDKKYHVSDHWRRESGRAKRELTRWLDFRRHQFRMREYSKTFNKYKEAVHKHRREKKIDWTVELQLDRQTKLDEWREYYIYEHRKRRALEKALDRAKGELEPAKERMRKAERNGSVGVHPNVVSERWGELRGYNKKISQAQNKVKMAQKRLEALGIEESLGAAERHMLIEQVEEDLESAQKRLEAEKLDELEQLNKEAERKHAQEVLAIAQGIVNGANTHLEQLDSLLEWIEGQFAEIAAEYASSSWGGRHNRHLLEGWEKYYVYERDKLQAEQDEVDRRVREPKTKGQRAAVEEHFAQARKGMVECTEKRWNALRAWFGQEFPEIAAEYAPNGDQRDRTGPPHSKRSHSDVTGKSTRRKRNSARERSALGQVQPLKVSKPRQRTTHHGVWPPEGHTNDVEVQGLPKVAVRRSERISQPFPGLVRAAEKSSQRRPDSTLRRSARILNRTKKPHLLGSDLDVKPARSSATAGQKSTRRTAVHTNTAYSGTPQGISKTGISRTRRWKATSKKGKNV